jgi:lantibiotic modifying enzyme
VQGAIRASLVRRLCAVVELAAEYQIKVFRNIPFLNRPSGLVGGISDPQRLFFSSGVEQQLILLTDSYPELTRILLVQIQNWRRFFEAFTTNVKKFIRSPHGTTSRRIRSLVSDVSDLHNGNTAVIGVLFSDNEEWYYKPRPGLQTAEWFGLLSAINNAGFSHPFKIPRLVLAPTHHWMEAVRWRPCSDESELKELLFRMGALLYLLDVLQAVDFHSGNLVCHGAQPVFVDCETLMHPESPMPEHFSAQEKGLFRIGILPRSGCFHTSVAALGPMTLTRILPGGQPPFPTDKIMPPVVDGFRAMHEFLSAQDGSCRHVLADTAARLRNSRCRVIYRPTVHYYSILKRSLAPDLLSNTAERLAFLRTECRTSYLAKHVIQAEVAALENLDIPFFLRRASARWRAPSRGRVRQSVREIRTSLSQ